jgi:hypothetical protein
MTLTEYFRTVTGFPLQQPQFSRFTVGDLKKDSRMPKTEFENYIRFLIGSGDNIKAATQVGQQFISNGKVYYYITRDNFRADNEK